VLIRKKVLIILLNPNEPTFISFPLTGYIDLSKRRVSPEDITKCEERYMKSKTVSSILRHVASKIASVDHDGEGGEASIPAASEPVEKESRKARKARQAAGDNEIPDADGGPAGGTNEEEKLEVLYETIAWPLGKKYGHPYDAFKLALTYVMLHLSYLILNFCTVSQRLFGQRCPKPYLNRHSHC
jgi:hypothetical protein